MSMGELLVIFFVALIVCGPERLPEIAKKLGRLIARMHLWRQHWQNEWLFYTNQEQLKENLRQAEIIERRYQESEQASNNSSIK